MVDRQGRRSSPLGIVIDGFHILSLGDDPEGIAAIPGEKIFFLQMAAAPRLAMDVLQWSRHYRCFPGQVQFDLPRFLEQVLVAGYTGPFSLEIFNDVFREVPNRRTAVDAMQSILYCEAQTRQRMAHDAGGSTVPRPARIRTLERIELFDPPAVPRLSGFAFLEFAVDEASEWLLDNVLEALGFRRAGRHRSKHVTLYRQGAISLILNAEPIRSHACTTPNTGRRSAPSELRRTTACARSTARRRLNARASTAGWDRTSSRYRQCARLVAAWSISCPRQRARARCSNPTST